VLVIDNISDFRAPTVIVSWSLNAEKHTGFLLQEVSIYISQISRCCFLVIIIFLSFWTY